MTRAEYKIQEMKLFDALPKQLRDFVNYNEVGIDANLVFQCYRKNQFRVRETLKQCEKAVANYLKKV